MIFSNKLLITSALVISMAAIAIKTIPANADNATLKISAFKLNNFYLTSSTNKAGKLEFMGGLELNANTKSFGGLSGLRVLDNGKQLISISDTAKWFTATLNRDANGQLTGISNTKLNCLCRNNGKPYGDKHWGDSEGLEIKGNKAYVSFERLNRINVYDLNNQNLPSNARQVTPSFKPLSINYNKGLEAVALAPEASPIAGKFFAIAEDSKNKHGNHRAFIASDKKIEELSIQASNDYRVTDADFLDNGDLIVLERKIGKIINLGMRIRRIKANAIAPGKKLIGEILLESGITSQIDNMEGIAAWKNSKGETILSLVSDDNFLRVQRTIYLEFKLAN